MDGKQKAIVGAVVAAVTAFLAAILAGLQAAGEGAGFADLDAAVWVTATIALLGGLGITGGAVYATPNRARTKPVTEGPTEEVEPH